VQLRPHPAIHGSPCARNRTSRAAEHKPEIKSKWVPVDSCLFGRRERGLSIASRFHGPSRAHEHHHSASDPWKQSQEPDGLTCQWQGPLNGCRAPPVEMKHPVRDLRRPAEASRSQAGVYFHRVAHAVDNDSAGWVTPIDLLTMGWAGRGIIVADRTLGWIMDGKDLGLLAT
jgi:hypothetical protein